MTVVSASGTPDAANHSRLKADRLIADLKLLSKPWMNTSRFLPVFSISA